MKIARHFIIHAVPGRESELESMLRRVSGVVSPIAGCEGIDFLRDATNAGRFILLEKWASVESHLASQDKIPKDLLAAMMRLIDGKPEGGTFEYIMST